MEIIVPIVTPLDEDFAVDEKGLRNLVDFVLDKGVSGIFVLGTTGEFQYIRNKKRTIEIVIDQVSNRCPVYAGVTEFTVEETVYQIMEIQNLIKKPDFLVIAPLVYHSNRKLFRHFERIEKFLQIPVYLYNNIGIITRKLKRKDIIPGIVEQLSKLDKISGIKDSSGNIKYFREIMGFRGEKFKVLQGDEGLIRESFLLGADGIVPSMGNIFPEILVNLINCLKNKQDEKSKILQEKIIEIRSVYLKYGITPAVLKEYLKRQGIIKTGTSFYKSNNLNEIVNQLEKKIENIKKEV